MNERYSIQEIKSKYLAILAILEICTEEIPGEIYSEIFTKEQKKTVPSTTSLKMPTSLKLDKLIVGL
jgi:hypothetical protein